MGTTGLETAFAALYTELVLPGELELEVIVERMTAGGGPVRARRSRGSSPAQPGEPRASSISTPGSRSAPRVREPLEQLLLPRPHAPRPGAADARRPATVAFRARMRRRDSGGPVTAADRLRPARGRHPLRRARLRRRRARGRRDRVHDLDVRLPGGDDRPELRGPADHVHLPADRQLRGHRPRRWSQTASTRGRRSCARRSTATTRRRASAGWLSWLADQAASRRSPTSTRARSCATSATRARCAEACSRPRSPESRGASADRGRAGDGRPRPGSGGHAGA